MKAFALKSIAPAPTMTNSSYPDTRNIHNPLTSLDFLLHSKRHMPVHGVTDTVEHVKQPTVTTDEQPMNEAFRHVRKSIQELGDIIAPYGTDTIGSITVYFFKGQVLHGCRQLVS